MKKIVLSVTALLILALAGYVVFQNRPIKRHARHLVKARLYMGEGNLTAAKLEYEKAYDILDGFSPFVSVEVLQLMNRISLQEKNLPEALANTKAFTAKHGHNLEGWVMLADLAVQARELQTAFEAIDTVLAREPGHFQARLLLARIRTRQGRLDLAEEQLRILQESAPDSIGALLPLAENLLRQGHIAESRAFLAKALASHPKSAPVRLLMVDGYLLERKLDSAQALFDSWKEADPSLALPLSIRKATLYDLQGRPDSAYLALSPFLAEKKEANFAAFSEWAVLLAKQGKYDSAVKVYTLMEEVRPASRGELLLLKAHLHLATREPARALEALRTLTVGSQSAMLLPLLAVTYASLDQPHKIPELLEKQPDSTRKRVEAFIAEFPPDREFIGQWALVNYYQITRQPQWVFKASRDLHGKWPKSPLAANLLASNLASLGRHAEAAQVLEKLPGRAAAQDLSLLSLYIRARQVEKARPLAERLLKADPGQKGLNLFLADYWNNGRDKQKAAEYYERELALDPENPVCLNNLAWEYGIVRKDLAKARPYLEKLQSRKAGDPRILDTIGWILARNGDTTGIALLSHASVLVPDHPVFRYHLAWALAQAGRKDEARKHLQVALDSKTAFAEQAEARQLSAQL
jgi:tetratricopeptide (TPR) repeat protein